ncbi:hypothetical protein OIU85_005502 [Salix viminalis]|uniref:Endonuclease/exonuclease/phosphatase domain-containing protein n=1 Tax=Salix viminalis TaxID=40686 RepID=A0A9Q0STN8_SALVM|nr:hypothetical protein OIU85_005502 [Salix viminalis]
MDAQHPKEPNTRIQNMESLAHLKTGHYEADNFANPSTTKASGKCTMSTMDSETHEASSASAGIQGVLTTLESSVEDNLNLTGWNFFSNVSTKTPCRILVGWNTATYNLPNFHQSPQWVTCDAYSITTKTTTHISFIYGHNKPPNRQPLWEYIVISSRLFNIHPWILMGDFNAVMDPDHRSGGDMRWLGHHDDFPKACHHAQLAALPYTGMKFSWNNGQQGRGNIQRKLDWVLENN